MNPFTWLRAWARNSVLAGVSDAAALLADGVEDPGPAAVGLFPRLGAPLAGADGPPRPSVLPFAPEASGGPSGATDGAPAGTPARKARKGEGRP